MARTRSHDDVGSDAVIGRATRVRGRVSGDGSLLIEGSVEGDIALRGDLTLFEGGRATSNVEAQAVTLGGDLEGDVVARGIVRIEASARVKGDVRGEAVSIEDGAEFTGRLDADFELPPELTGTSATAAGRRR